MTILYWIIIIALIVLAFAGLVYPVLPSAPLILIAYLLYGFFFSFEKLNLLFWIIQVAFVILLFLADHLTNLYSVKKFGGSKAGIWGSTIGLLLGPFVIPVMGILLGPFIGAILAELIFAKRSFKDALMIGTASVIGFISSVFVKGFMMIVMVVYFIILVL